MARTLPSPSELKRQQALAQLQIAQLQSRLNESRAALHRGSGDLHQTLPDALLGEIAETLERLDTTLEAPIGLSVQQTADALQVSLPTVRKWVKGGLLQRVPDSAPIEVEPRSVHRLGRTLERVRLNFPAREWTRALAAYLHDTDLQGQDWVADGIADLRASRLVTR